MEFPCDQLWDRRGDVRYQYPARRDHLRPDGDRRDRLCQRRGAGRAPLSIVANRERVAMVIGAGAVRNLETDTATAIDRGLGREKLSRAFSRSVRDNLVAELGVQAVRIGGFILLAR